MGQMEKLEIRSDGTLSLSGLENMKQLKTLYLSGFRDTLACVDLDALSGLTSLTELTLDIDGQVTDLSPLSGLVNLTYLDLYAFDVPPFFPAGHKAAADPESGGKHADRHLGAAGPAGP